MKNNLEKTSKLHCEPEHTLPFLVKTYPCLTKHYAMKANWGIGCIALCILDLSTRWRWAVSFTPRPLYSQGKSLLYPLSRRLGGPHMMSIYYIRVV